jgi:hypothetical protein
MTRISDLHRSQMTSGEVDRPDNIRGANGADRTRSTVMSLGTVWPLSHTPDVGASATGKVRITPHSRHIALAVDISSLIENASLTTIGRSPS